jgi:hypothetical protein
MLAQSRRVALRKVALSGGGRMTLFSRIHERDGTYTAGSREGDTNVGLRIEQLAWLGVQLGVLGTAGDAPVTARGEQLLGVPR